MSYDFPNGPTAGQIVTAPSGASYIFDGTKWVGYGSGGTPSGAAGGDLTGLYPDPLVAHVDGAAVSTGTVVYARLPTEVQQVPIAFPFGSKPAASAVVNIPMAMALTVPASLTGTRVFASTAPTGTPTFTLNRLVGTTPTAIGTVQFTGQTTATLAGAGATLNAGDTLQIVAPSSQDATLADCSISLLATRV